MLEFAAIEAAFGPQSLLIAQQTHWNVRDTAVQSAIGDAAAGVGAGAGILAAPGLTGAVAAGAAGGATGGGLSAAYYGGNVGQDMLRGAAYGAATSLAFYGAVQLYTWAVPGDPAAGMKFADAGPKNENSMNDSGYSYSGAQQPTWFQKIMNIVKGVYGDVSAQGIYGKGVLINSEAKMYPYSCWGAAAGASAMVGTSDFIPGDYFIAGQASGYGPVAPAAQVSFSLGSRTFSYETGVAFGWRYGLSVCQIDENPINP